MIFTQEFYARCRITLLKCREFDEHALLQAVFVSELRIFRDGLPQTATRENRVDQTLDYLERLYERGNRLVLPSFLTKLQQRCQPGDVLRDELAQLCADVEQALRRLDYLDLPVVIVTMTHQEASDLINETAFATPDVAPAEQAKFQQLKAVFPENEIAAWLAHYAEEREDWKPYTQPQHTIRSLILDTMRRQHDPQAGLNGPLIRPHFLSSDFLTPDDQQRLDTWDHLSKSGCVMIVDAISLFHPVIYRRLLQSEMSSNPQVALALLILAPEAHQVNVLIEQELKERLQRAFARFVRYRDGLCVLDMNREHHLPRWLNDKLPEVAKKMCLTPHFANRQMMQQRVTETHGMGQIISGQWSKL